jgi:CRP-like cAMP-binding protein/ATP/ADP translocase
MERFRQAYFGTALFVQVNLIVLTFICRDALFVRNFGREHRAEYSAAAILLSSVVSTPAFTLASKMTRSLGPSNVGGVVAMLCSGSFVMFYAGLEHSMSVASLSSASSVSYSSSSSASASSSYLHSVFASPHFLVGLFYVSSDVMVMLITNGFWELCNSTFKITETKIAFGNINLGNTVANLFVGFLFSPLLERLEVTTTHRILIMAMLSMTLSLLLFSAQFLFRGTIQQLHQQQQLQQRQRQKQQPGGEEAAAAERQQEGSLPIRKILARSYYRHICLFEFCATALRVFVDLQTINVLASALEQRAFESKLALIKGISALLMIPMQLGTGPILSSVGVMYGLATLPLATWCFGLGTMLLPSVAVVVVLRSLHDATGYTLFTTSRELLFLPLTSRERRTVKPLVTGVVRSLAKACGALLSIMMKRLFQGDAQTSSSYILGVMIVTIATVWLADVLGARRAYAGEFYQLLQSMTSRGAALSSERADVRAFDMADPKVLAAVYKTLKSGTPVQQIFIFDSLPAHSVKQFRSELYSLMRGHVSRSNIGGVKPPLLKTKHSRLNSSFSSFDGIANTPSSSLSSSLSGGMGEGVDEVQVSSAGSYREKGGGLYAKEDDRPIHHTAVPSPLKSDKRYRRLRSSQDLGRPSLRSRSRDVDRSPRMQARGGGDGGREYEEEGEEENSDDVVLTNAAVANYAASAPNSPRGARSHSMSGLTDTLLSEVCDQILSSPKVHRLPVSPSQLSRRRSNLSMNSGMRRPVIEIPAEMAVLRPELGVAIRKKALQILCKAQLSSADDMLILVCDPHLNREVRTEAVRACGLFKYDSPQLRRKLEELSGLEAPGFEDLRVSAAISLLRMTNWLHTKAHVAVYKMLHNEHSLRARIVALSTVGKELPELISDGYLAYLLHISPPGSSLLDSAVRCCSGRRSTILLPQLAEKLSDPSLQALVINALLTYEDATVLALANPALDSAVSHIIAATATEIPSAIAQRSIIVVRGWVQWMNKCIDRATRDECVSLVLNVTKSAAEGICVRWGTGAQHLQWKSRAVEALEPLIDYLLHVSPEPSTLATVRSRVSRLLMSTSKVESKEASDNPLLQLVLDIIEDGFQELQREGARSPQTLQVVRLGAQLRRNVRILLKLCAIRYFPSSLSVDLIFEALLSSDINHSAAAREVVENLLQGTYRTLALPKISRWIEIDSKSLRVPISTDDANDAMAVPRDRLSDLETFRVLMRSSLFQNVALQDVQSVVESGDCISQKFEPTGSVFARAGEEAAEIFIVACGEVTVFVPGFDGGDHFGDDDGDDDFTAATATLRTGDCIGERRLSALFWSESESESSSLNLQLERETSARASTDCILIVVSVKKFAGLLRKSPTMLRGVLSVLLLDLRRCFLFRVIRIRRRLKIESGSTSPSGGGGGGGRGGGGRGGGGGGGGGGTGSSQAPKTPLTKSASASLDFFDQDRALHKRFSKLSTKSGGTFLATATRAEGMRTARLSMLETCICLKDARAFQHLGMDTIRALAEIAEQRVFRSGELIFCEGGQSSFLFLVVEGSCHLYSSIVGDGDRVVGRIGNGAIAGELALIPQSSRLVTCKVAAQSPRGEVLVLSFESSALLKLMANNESISKAVAQHVLWRLDKERKRSEKLDVFSTATAPGTNSRAHHRTISPAWAKIRSSVVALPQNMGLRRRWQAPKE